MEWINYPHFTLKEMECQETAICDMNPAFMEKLELLRVACAFPFVITSGYRDPTHSIEVKKVVPGYHAQGMAVDIAATGVEKYIIIKEAMRLGFNGIGVHRQFVHLDTGNRPNPVVFAY